MLCCKRNIAACLVAALPYIILTGCKVGPDFHPPWTPTSNRYTHSPLPTHTVGKPQKLVVGQTIPNQWWTVFHNPTLNQLIDKGLRNSPTLASAEAALVEARETLTAQTGALLFPNATGNLSATRQKISADATGDSATGQIFNLYNASVNVSYTLDFFGGARRQLESLLAQVEYQQFQQEAAKLTLAGNIATTTLTIASLREQISATKSMITSETEQLAIIQQQLALGGAAQADVLLQQNQLAALKATLPPLKLSLDKNIHLLAVLTGQSPAALSIPHFDLNQFVLPARLPLQLPSSILKQRPDVRASLALLHAANAQIGVATANLLPQFNITGLIGYESNLPSRLFKASNSTWNMGAALLQPLVNGGSLRATRRAAIAAKNLAEANYQQTVLQALQNVADSLRAIQRDAETLTALQAATRASFHSLEIIRNQYQLGGTSYLNVLTADIASQKSRLTEITATTSRLSDTVALFVAMGGGMRQEKENKSQWHKQT